MLLRPNPVLPFPSFSVLFFFFQFLISISFFQTLISLLILSERKEIIFSLLQNRRCAENCVESVFFLAGREGGNKQRVKTRTRRAIGLYKTGEGTGKPRGLTLNVSIAGGIKYRSTIFARFSSPLPRLIPRRLP